MNNPVDKRQKLADSPFDYQVTKDGQLFVFWQGKQVKTLKGEAAKKLIDSLDVIDQDGDENGIQLALAKVTGNFKRGNERKQP